MALSCIRDVFFQIHYKVATRMSLGSAVLGNIGEFSVDCASEWVEYVERLEQYFIANSINDADKKRAVFPTVIGPRAYSLLRNLVAPEKPATKSYSDLVDVMTKHLNPKPIVIAERLKYHRRNQEEGETVAQYLAALRKLSEHCHFRVGRHCATGWCVV